MKLLIISGSQNRHLSILPPFLNLDGITVDWIVYKRKLVPQSTNPSVFLQEHLNRLQNDELSLIGKYNLEELLANPSIHRSLLISNLSDLNSQSSSDFAFKSFSYDATLVYGCGIIKKQLYETLPKPVINIHGGISPYFKGSSTLLYSLALGQPELLGMTIHDIDEGIDSGSIYCHIFPHLNSSMRPTRMFAECQKALIHNIAPIVQCIVNKSITSTPQSKFGRTFMERDYREQVLHSIYTMYEQNLYSFTDSSLKTLRSLYKLKPWNP